MNANLKKMLSGLNGMVAQVESNIKSASKNMSAEDAVNFANMLNQSNIKDAQIKASEKMEELNKLMRDGN